MDREKQSGSGYVERDRCEEVKGGEEWADIGGMVTSRNDLLPTAMCGSMTLLQTSLVLLSETHAIKGCLTAQGVCTHTFLRGKR